MKIKQGYRISVTTWENDADNYNTKTLDGLTREVVEFYVEFAKLHKSKNSYTSNVKCWGNMYEPSDEEIEEYVTAMRPLFKKYINVVASFYDSDFSPEWIEHDDFSDMIGNVSWDLGICSGEFYTRVVDKIEIQCIPQDIEMLDCTDEFV